MFLPAVCLLQQVVCRPSWKQSASVLPWLHGQRLAPHCVNRRAQRVRAGRQVNVALIVLFNYYYTFLQLDPKDMADQLKRSGASIPAVRPGRATADYITNTLNRMSILGSAFLGALAAAPPLVEAVTKLQVRRRPA